MKRPTAIIAHVCYMNAQSHYCLHTHHTHTPLYSVSIEYVGTGSRNKILLHSGRQWMKANHAARSFATACQLVSSVGSLIITSIHLGDPHHGLFPLGLHFKSCFCRRLSGILFMWPYHCSCFASVTFQLAILWSPSRCQHFFTYPIE